MVTEALFGDRYIGFLYSRARERAPLLFRALTGARFSSVLAFVNFDLPLASRLAGNARWLAERGVDLSECVEPASHFTTPRRVFERQIRYWECRPMPTDSGTVVSPADARVLVGSLRPGAGLFIKDKFFDLPQLLGTDRRHWQQSFEAGDFAVFRLTPDKYHYNHCPVSGRVEDVYGIDGAYHSCNPQAVVELATPYSSNRRTVSIIQTDVPGGTGVGRVAMVEVVALMIGDLVQCYSDVRYEAPQPLRPGLFVQRGQPQSLYRPGSSTDILLFEPGRIEFLADLTANQRRADAQSRFTTGFGRPLVETEVSVRAAIAAAPLSP